MTKIIGVILILSSSIIYGFVMSGELKIQYDELLELKKIMFLLRGEIEYSICPIREALGNISERCSDKFKSIIFSISEDNEKNFSESWKREWEKGFKTLKLSKEEQKDIILLNEGIGLRDKDSQIKQIELYLLRLENSIDAMKVIIPKKSRVYKCLSVAFGIFLSIIII